MRPNQLVGYGLVIGLNGTGDSLRNSPFTEQSLQAMLDRMGVNIRKQNTRTKNAAAVIVTAELPAFVQSGSKIDVTVSSLGDATSLLGGSLIMTPLYGADNLIYAVAQGAVTVSGYQVEGAAQTVTQNVPTSGRIPNGALIEREAPGQFVDVEFIGLELHQPRFRYCRAHSRCHQCLRHGAIWHATGASVRSAQRRRETPALDCADTLDG